MHTRTASPSPLWFQGLFWALLAAHALDRPDPSWLFAKPFNSQGSCCCIVKIREAVNVHWFFCPKLKLIISAYHMAEEQCSCYGGDGGTPVLTVVGDLWHFGADPDPYLWLMDPTPFFSDWWQKNFFFIFWIFSYNLHSLKNLFFC
jgi:hypothetical protein